MLQSRRRSPLSLLRDHWTWLAVQVAIVAGGIVTYFGVRGVTEGSVPTARAHAHEIVDLEKHLGLAHERAFQALVVDSQTLTTVANWIYIWGHWPVIIATMAWLVVSHPTQFVRLRNAMLISGGLGLIVFTAYPVAPPRLANLGLVDTVTQHSDAYRVLQPPAFVNQYAAMPSLHVGWDLLIGIAIATTASRLLVRWVGRLMPVLMALAVVVTANHYILDVIAGASLATVSLGGVLLLERRTARTSVLKVWARRRLRRPLGGLGRTQPGFVPDPRFARGCCP